MGSDEKLIVGIDGNRRERGQSAHCRLAGNTFVSAVGVFDSAVGVFDSCVGVFHLSVVHLIIPWACSTLLL